MTKKEKVYLFIDENDDETIKNYHDKLFENLKELNSKEEKHTFWLCVVIFLYLLSGNVVINNIELGPVTINDSTALIKILPLIFVYILYVLHTITWEKKEISIAFNIISANRFNSIDDKENANSFLSRIYKPFEYSNIISSLSSEKPHIVEAIFGFLILLPLLIIGISPYIIAFSMIFDLYHNYMFDSLGKLSFCLTLWLFIITIFQFIVSARKNYVEENS